MAAAESTVYAKGLEGVIAGETAISNVEGDFGRLTYRGVPIEALIELDYEAVAWLVLFGTEPDAAEQAALKEFLNEESVLAGSDRVLLTSMSTDLHAMQVLQAALPALVATPRTDRLRELDEEARRGLALVSKLPSLVAGYHRLSLENALPEHVPGGSSLGNFLTQFTGSAPSDASVAALTRTQILQIEHSFNAGTFAARVVSSTLAPVEAVLCAGVGALAGQLHGGADEAALREAQKVGNAAAAPTYVTDLLARKGKLMGMGHREYRKVDPRAKLLKPMAVEAAFAGAMAKRGKELWANVEFYKGAVFKALGIPEEYFTALFAMARSIGWLAHFIESREDNRIIRPKALYVGR